MALTMRRAWPRCRPRHDAATGLVRRALCVPPRGTGQKADDAHLQQRFSELINLADKRYGAEVLFATDEWFATADNLLKPSDPTFDPDAFCSQGKVMDGWESRRRRLPGFDWSIIQLGLAGFVHGVEIDTAWFTGNQVPNVAVQAAEITEVAGGSGGAHSWLGERRDSLGKQGSAATPEEIAAASAAVEAHGPWFELVPMSPLRPGYDAGGQSVHRYSVPPELAARRVTHLRLNTYPDGGIARLRAWGVVSRDFEAELAPERVGRIDLLSASLGGRAIGCSNRHYGEPRNLLQPARGVNMGDGWETARNPNRPAQIRVHPETGQVDMPGAHDWCVLRLAASASCIDELIIDTEHFKGNFPESVLVEGCYAPTASSSELEAERFIAEDLAQRVDERGPRGQSVQQRKARARHEVGDDDVGVEQRPGAHALGRRELEHLDAHSVDLGGREHVVNRDVPKLVERARVDARRGSARSREAGRGREGRPRGS